MHAQLLPRLARAEAQAHARYATLPGGSGQCFGPLVAVWAGRRSPLSCAWLAEAAVPSAEDWHACEAFFAERGAGCTLHLLSHAAPALLPVLSGRGYHLTYVLHAYLHTLRDLSPPGRFVIREENDAEAWAAYSAQGFGAGSEEVMWQVAHAPGTRRLVALTPGANGGAVATAALGLQDGVAALFGTSTLPAARDQGVQAALLAHRLHLARDLGADCASVFVTPGSGSERNVVRAGFGLAGMRLSFFRRVPAP